MSDHVQNWPKAILGSIVIVLVIAAVLYVVLTVLRWLVF